MKASELKSKILASEADQKLQDLCGVSKDDIPAKRARLAKAVDEFVALYGDMDNAMLLSVGGRSEVSGNHTDHNHGKVMAAAINLDIIAVAAPTSNGVVTVKSEGFDADVVEPAKIDSPCKDDFFTSGAIIAGMEKAFLNNGFKVGGFNAYTTSNVFKGSGLSSSAAFEVMIGNILNNMYNDGVVDNTEIAKMAQYSENVYFGKPCGLMDQTACAVGGFISIDFKDPTKPIIEKIDFDLSKEGYSLCIVDTGGNHADLNDDYASVPTEMKKVAAMFGKEVLRDVDEELVVENASKVRSEVGDRALMRALHFYEENKRVEMQCAALKAKDIDAFFGGVLKSGLSSFRFLQNVYTTKNVEEQGLSLALLLTELYLSGKGGAFRVHGGGFAGTIQAMVPNGETEGYKAFIEKTFGEGKCYVLSVRAGGAIRIL